MAVWIAWKGRDREGIMEGVRMRRREWKAKMGRRKDWVVVVVARILVLSVSDHSPGVSVSIGPEG